MIIEGYDLIDKYLLERMSDQALFIKAADRIDNLNTIDVFPEEKQIDKAVWGKEDLNSRNL